jgi:hypothetical protein
VNHAGSNEDFTKNGLTYDIIFDKVKKSSFSSCKGSLKKSGFYLTTAKGLALFFHMLWTSMIGGKKVISGIVNPKSEDLIFFGELTEAGNINQL